LMRSKFEAEDIATATTQLDSIRTAIENKSITFEKAAEKYSHDEDTKFTGGLAVNSAQANMSGSAKMKSNKFFIDELAGDAEALETLKEGEISAPFQTTDNPGNLVCKIVKLNKRIPAHTADIKQDYIYLVDVAREIKMQQTFDKWLKAQKAKMYVRIEEPYNQFPIIKASWDK
ncbi:MAG: peptidylprolyl isomerase, partial [Rikenellaceae bacterium]